MSAKKRRELAERRPIREAVFDRDGHRCQLALVPGAGECFGRLTPHHVVKERQGGSYSLDNLVTLCAHHNDQLEADADLAQLGRQLGIVRSPWENATGTG